MDLRDFFSGILQSSSEISNDVVQIAVSDVFFVLAILGAVIVTLLVLVVSLLAKLRRPAVDPNVKLVSGIRGKLEKLEMTLNQLKTERARAKEFYKVEFSTLRNELSDVREAMRNAGTSFKESTPPPTSDTLEPDVDIDVDELERVHDEVVAEDIEEFITGEEPEQEATDDVDVKKKDLSEGLKKTRVGFFQKLQSLFSGKNTLDAGELEELEALLLSCDIGVETTTQLIAEVESKVAGEGNFAKEDLIALLTGEIASILATDDNHPPHILINKQADGPMVVLMVGVNGVGKTTTVAKLTHAWKQEGKSVLLVAADTFRAAAVEQLQTWGQRLEVPVVHGAENAKPGTVVFDAMKKAQEEAFDVVLIDTAGRLHNKSNLMQELEGVRNAIQRYQPSAPHETLLVVDGTTGQNALEQAKQFNEAVPLSGVIITKLDGSPKGGIVVAIKRSLGIPIRFVGVGEAFEDLQVFNADQFAAALFDETGTDTSMQDSAAANISAHGRARRRRRDTSWTV